jgi:hypothetical protein
MCAVIVAVDFNCHYCPTVVELLEQTQAITCLYFNLVRE